jgi:hypothetical protein
MEVEMNPELWMVFIPPFGAMLFALGGTEISDTIPGQKWTRRFVFPFILGLSVFFAGYGWKALAVFAISCFALHQGYGIKQRWFVPVKHKGRWLPPRIATFALYATISLPVGWTHWNWMTAVGASLLFVLSNTKWSADTFVWKPCEALMGFLIGMQVAILL